MAVSGFGYSLINIKLPTMLLVVSLSQVTVALVPELHLLLWFAHTVSPELLWLVCLNGPRCGSLILWAVGRVGKFFKRWIGSDSDLIRQGKEARNSQARPTLHGSALRVSIPRLNLNAKALAKPSLGNISPDSVRWSSDLFSILEHK